MSNVILVDDLVSGINGVFVKKEPAPNAEGRVIIYYKKPTISQFFEKPQKIPANVPVSGIIEVPGVKCADGFGRIIIFSYGDDLMHPPLITNLIKENVGDLIKSLEKANKQLSLKSSALEAKERVMDRHVDEIVEKRLKASKNNQLNNRFPNLRGL